MIMAVRLPMSMTQFLDWEARQEIKHEFDGEAAAAMTGARVAHVAIQGNLLAALLARLRGTPCRPYGSDLQLRAQGRVRYPDAMVVRSPLAPDDGFCANPTVVFEIISPSSARTDRIAKVREYWEIPSILHYVILEQGLVSALHCVRAAGKWQTTLLGPDDRLVFPEIGVSLALAELYDGLDFTDPSAG